MGKTRDFSENDSRVEKRESLVYGEDGFTEKERLFVAEYLIDPTNGTAAAIRAGYKPHSAHAMAYQLLRTPRIKRLIESRRKELTARLEVTQERIVKEYARIAMVNVGDFYTDDENGNVRLKELDELTEDQKAAIARIRTAHSEDGKFLITKLEFHDKLAGLNALSKHLGLFEKDNRQKAPNFSIDELLASFPEELRDSVRRAMLKKLEKK